MHISVIIPFFNAAQTVERSLASAQNQSSPASEILVVDDGSDPADFRFLESISDLYKFRIIRTPNRGVAAARNTGARAATGELLAFLDADDLWHPKYLELLGKRFVNCNVGFVFSRLEWIDDSDQPIGVTNRPIPNPSITRLLTGNFVGSGSNFIVRRECFESAGGFSSELRYVEDYCFALRVFLDGNWKAEQVPEVLVGYRKSPETKSRHLKPMWESLVWIARSVGARMNTYQKGLLRFGILRIFLSLYLSDYRQRLGRRRLAKTPVRPGKSV
jgi:glycosyltransferase involved in cell wall biosynthesis